ncbi:NADH-quinone oxidoreductase subunit A [Microbulbifer sp. 2205BS26-8]|uniref:NADH-quinone oxidoreductase subunit A n=1 Tax=Microbulbifer sp. 2205BS26-8 TaxID=3064386 RepID=UPI00273D9D6C|nr:NADH-quinone oxidoreductase subunit A [Microbulbifer sp. 2205BS26-8]MDP5209178.1 NADH-quinone oxidoreductase subunit A [Microbulbifer sp. 2205BS26-8]
MNHPDQFNPEVWPLVVYCLAVFGLIALMLGLSYFLGQKRRDPATDEPFESGIISQGNARLRISVAYYLVAILFIVFDLEAIYLFSWSIAFFETGLLGFIEATVFIVILLVGLIYLWRLGALEWGGRQESLVDRKDHR